MTNTPQTSNPTLDKLKDRIYLALETMHKSKHLKSGCFCTTEVSGAFRFSLEAIDSYIESKIELAKIEAKIEELRDTTNMYFDDSTATNGIIKLKSHNVNLSFSNRLSTLITNKDKLNDIT